MADGGSLFGTTAGGGCCGTVYELTPTSPGSAWAQATLYEFTGMDGQYPAAPVTLGPGGVLYGTTQFGGTGYCRQAYSYSGCGTVFQLTPASSPGGAWTETVLYNFMFFNGDGGYPTAGVVVGKNGELYGTTQGGGNALSTCGGCGTVFELLPPATPGGQWTEKVFHVFGDRVEDGTMPMAGLVLSSSGILYGTTFAGGAKGAGTVFAIKP